VNEQNFELMHAEPGRKFLKMFTLWVFLTCFKKLNFLKVFLPHAQHA
jgi:hypothetical protein